MTPSMFMISIYLSRNICVQGVGGEDVMSGVVVQVGAAGLTSL